MRALVTGASGFVAARPARRLLEQGAEVRRLLRNPDSDPHRSLAAEGVEIHAQRVFDIEPVPFERTLREALAEDGVIAAAGRS